jgi:hypothetical protein
MEEAGEVPRFFHLPCRAAAWPQQICSQSTDSNCEARAYLAMKQLEVVPWLANIRTSR